MYENQFLIRIDFFLITDFFFISVFSTKKPPEEALKNTNDEKNFYISEIK